MSKNLFFTGTAVGTYAAVLVAVLSAVGGLADKHDEGTLKATDWIRAFLPVGGAIASQLFILSRRLDPNQAPVYTPPGLPGPNKEDIKE